MKKKLSKKGCNADTDKVNFSELKRGPLKPTDRKKKQSRRKLLRKNIASLLTEISYKKIDARKTFNQKNCGRSSLNQTIDLCDDSVSENIHCISDSKENTDVSVLCLKDTCDRNEVIDLTTTSKKPISCEPTVIDLSLEEHCESAGTKNESDDDIFVIETFSNVSHSGLTSKKSSGYIPLLCKSSKTNKLACKAHKVKEKHQKKIRCPTNKNESFCWKKFQNSLIPNPDFAGVGENVYCSTPAYMPKNGLRPIIIDGSNVAFVHQNNEYYFSCKRLETCIKYFKEKGHRVIAFVPQFRTKFKKSDNPQLLRKLELQGDVILTPSKEVDGKFIVPYDDRFVVQTAVLKGGIIVSRDNFNDLLKENPAWADTIKYRTLAFTWVDDVLIFPRDPLGEHGPSLQEFLKF